MEVVEIDWSVAGIEKLSGFFLSRISDHSFQWINCLQFSHLGKLMSPALPEALYMYLPELYVMLSLN